MPDTILASATAMFLSLAEAPVDHAISSSDIEATAQSPSPSLRKASLETLPDEATKDMGLYQGLIFDLELPTNSPVPYVSSRPGLLGLVDRSYIDSTLSEEIHMPWLGELSPAKSALCRRAS
ncbi:hypothetical protein B0H63DRAFT_487227 [Podospora didyma]|uniref:Uncharacterized protein n=1 Tax=Podospora didyma TaxID=330526 RepID=A0AAE0N5U9_9PEZI|nr:hypothetical protein B0H63DRAFT_487227 [Podospora didyma]